MVAIRFRWPPTAADSVRLLKAKLAEIFGEMVDEASETDEQLALVSPAPSTKSSGVTEKSTGSSVPSHPADSQARTKSTQAAANKRVREGQVGLTHRPICLL